MNLTIIPTSDSITSPLVMEFYANGATIRVSIDHVDEAKLLTKLLRRDKQRGRPISQEPQATAPATQLG